MKKVLCIEDNSGVADLIVESLVDCEVTKASELCCARDFIYKSSVDLITLDLGMPDGDGLRFLAELNSSPVLNGIPVFVLSARQEIEAKVMAFTIGAEDYILKPFDPMELKIRVEAKLRKIDRQRERFENVRYGDLQVSVSKHRVWKLNEFSMNRELVFTSIEFKLLVAFINSPERVLSRNYLLNEVWGDSLNVTDRTVDTHVGHLRKKIYGTKAKIYTVIGEGYKIAVQ
jgi:DNA-binding response OmpR family regulator